MYILVYFTKLWLKTYNPDFFDTTTPSIHFEAPRIVSYIMNKYIRKYNGQARKSTQYNQSFSNEIVLSTKAYIHVSYYFVIFKYEYSLFNYEIHDEY